MSLVEITYPVAPRGLATSFAESEVPLEFSTSFRNRFVNAAGAAEKRQGIEQIGDTITGGPNLTGIHELVLKDGTTIDLTSGQGRIYRLSGSAWNQVYASGAAGAVMRSVQFNDKLIFVNGVDRNIYTTDASAWSELEAIIEQGDAGTATSANGVSDSDIANWITATDVVTNDLVFYPTRRAYGLVTVVASAALSHTAVSASATGIGVASSGAPAPNDPYRIIDLVELNIVPVPNGLDNVAVAGSGTSVGEVRVSGLDFSLTDIRVGDIISNTTRSAVTQVLAVSSNVAVTPIAAQVAGDSLVFLKSAMPIAAAAHVHYGRLYLLDARDRTKVRISGADDPTDFTTDAATLDSTSFNFGGLQPQGDTLLAMGSFQQFFVLMGKKHVYMYQGTQPVRSSAASTDFDFSPVGLFPHGGVAADGLTTIGNDLVFAAHDGVMSVTQTQDSSTLNRTNLSEPIRATLRRLLTDTPADQVQLVHYPQRSWLMLKVGSQIYSYNYSAFVGPGAPYVQAGAANETLGSWSLFDGKLAQQNFFTNLSDGRLVACGPGGKVFEFDQNVYTDDGEIITTEYRTPWLTMEEKRGSKGSVRKKEGKYLKPIVEAGGPMVFDFSVEAPFNGESSDSVSLATSGGSTPIGLWIIGTNPIGGSPVQNDKVPFRWNGEVARLTVRTSSAVGPDVLSRFTVYHVMRGRV